MMWDAEELLKTKEASVPKRGKGVGKGRKREKREEEEEEEDVTVTMSMVGDGLRKATYKARLGKNLKVAGRGKLKKGETRKPGEGNEELHKNRGEKRVHSKEGINLEMKKQKSDEGD
jgi:hypothetical protein